MKYVAVIRSTAVRDAQFCTSPECDLRQEETWRDDRTAEIFLGVFNAPSEQEARQKAAEFGCTAPENIRLIPVYNN